MFEWNQTKNLALYDHNYPILKIAVFLTDQLFVNAPFVKIVMITEPAKNKNKMF